MESPMQRVLSGIFDESKAAHGKILQDIREGAGNITPYRQGYYDGVMRALEIVAKVWDETQAAARIIQKSGD